MLTPHASEMINQFNQQILDSLPHWAMLIDGRTRSILAANKLAKEGGAEVGGQCWDDFGHRAALPLEQKELIQREPARKRDNEIKCEFCLADEAVEGCAVQRKEVEVDGVIYDTHWVPVKESIYLHDAIDITDLRQAEANKLEAASLKAAIETAGAACHELNQPLQALTFGLEMLALNNPDVRQEAEKPLGQAERMSEVTRKLLNITEYRTKEYVDGLRILDMDGDQS